ncbi:MAG: hypothetical protein CL489_10550 [Acidobacteria bacterium]|nr:hypothetical protein [Acidobacteriota bacterium]|tara:strand:- start:1273 stop:1809 length:537 start_codon:yes stop_codon:yes gene_type:complete
MNFLALWCQRHPSWISHAEGYKDFNNGLLFFFARGSHFYFYCYERLGVIYLIQERLHREVVFQNRFIEDLNWLESPLFRNVIEIIQPHSSFAQRWNDLALASKRTVDEKGLEWYLSQIFQGMISLERDTEKQAGYHLSPHQLEYVDFSPIWSNVINQINPKDVIDSLKEGYEKWLLLC